MGDLYSSGCQNIIKAIGILFFGFFALFIPDIGPFLFLLSLFFVIRTLYQAWLLSEREFAVTNRDNVPNITSLDRIFLLSHQTPWRYKVKNYLILDNIKKEHKINKKNKKLINFKKVDSFFEKLEKSIFYVSGTVDHKFSLFCETVLMIPLRFGLMKWTPSQLGSHVSN